ncbi:response regulator transcription factor [Oceanirhabdus seepicola]|uniref:Stage 0 sporulation protein A homolog n=1 Tax=Oceanirhabdus seepicola TaxID=2828781 RepID=A0A9J6P651_9CLOT|nr:response regulator transcription factor [Oceanirhabdus seepicola]MCM1992207.1 response regulator transcription factor [Oceanirhabdus seepicola]
MNKSILIIEDEQKIRRVMKDYLVKEGFQVYEAEDGEKGLELFNNMNIDLVVLDIMLPKQDGWTVCRKIREVSNTLIVMVTARNEEDDNLLGYKIGADDYISKPFRVKVLVAKINALLKLKDKSKAIEDPTILFEYSDLKVYLTSHKVYLKNEEIDLPLKQYDLLCYFIKNQNLALSRTQILDKVWGIDFEGEDRAVDTCVKRLRAKLGEKNLPLKAVWGYGYRFEVNQ